MFKAFDVNQAGFIDKFDMETAVKALGWNKNQLYELIQELDPNHNGDVTFEEFVLIMKYIFEFISDDFHFAILQGILGRMAMVLLL